MNRNFVKIALLAQFLLLLPTATLLNDFINISHDISCFFYLSIFYVFVYGLLSPWMFKDYIEENYGMLSKIHLFTTYQYQTFILAMLSIPFIYLLISCSYIMGYLSKGLLCSVFFIIPIISLIFGTKTFNDSSCIINDEVHLGYPPIYPVISLIIGLFGYSFILNTNVNNDIVLIITLIFQVILVLPHVFNRITPFEIRTIKGCLYFLIPCIVAYFLLINLSTVGTMFNSTDSMINPARILKNILVYGAGLICIALFYKQAKEWNERKK